MKEQEQKNQMEQKEQMGIPALYRELLGLRNEKLMAAAQILEQRKAEMQKAVNDVAIALGIDLKETWTMSEDMRVFTKITPPPVPTKA
jgi:hypothetical protein